MRDARIVARALLGCRIVSVVDGDERIARIVETEAYRGPRDLACHARAGLTKRTRTLFGPEGRAYVFFIYGMHECANVVCNGEGSGHAVLLRAAEPVSNGLARMDGPGRMTKALGINRSHDGIDLRGDTLFLLPRDRRPKISITARVGVAYAKEWADKPYRFLDRESEHVSRPPRKSIGLG